ncbi:MAG: hypothetical protein KC636_15755 [Myxococcales bacterium]|nr:hypothetical protein [Myxococcales bacterium]
MTGLARTSSLLALCVTLVASCGDPSGRGDDGLSGGSNGLTGGEATLDAATQTAGDETGDAPTTGSTGDASTSGGPLTTTSEPGSDSDLTDPTGMIETTDAPLEPRLCGFSSTTYGQGLAVLDVPKGSPERLVFTVPSLPDPALVLAATLRFDSHDADHPGEEGRIWLNGQGPYDLPADASWDNQDGVGQVDVSGATIAGDNTVEFGPGALEPASYYFIGNVALEVTALVDACPEPPPPAAVERTVWYQDASYTKRHNWVLRCDDYAYTAKGDEHLDEDCEGLYAPDGTRKGKAVFAFPALVPATYEVRVRARHTVNRNPLGALFVVDGEGKRIKQNDDLDYVVDVWGTAALAGDVEVVLDSSMEGESDSVIWVKLVPVG